MDQISLTESDDVWCNITDYILRDVSFSWVTLSLFTKISNNTWKSELLVVFLSKPQKMPTDAEEQLLKDFIRTWNSVDDPFLENIRFKDCQNKKE